MHLGSKLYLQVCVGVSEASDVLPVATTIAPSDAVCMCKPDGLKSR